MSETQPIFYNPDDPSDKHTPERVMTVYDISGLFTHRHIREVQGWPDGNLPFVPGETTMRIWDHGFTFLRPQSYFVSREEAVAFAQKALHAFYCFRANQRGELENDIQFADSFQNKTAAFADRELIEAAPKLEFKVKGKKRGK